MAGCPPAAPGLVRSPSSSCWPSAPSSRSRSVRRWVSATPRSPLPSSTSRSLRPFRPPPRRRSGVIIRPTDPRLSLAAGAVADAYAARGLTRPAVGAGTGPALRVTAGTAATSEAYTIKGLTVSGESVAGAAAGLYRSPTGPLRRGLAGRADGAAARAAADRRRLGRARRRPGRVRRGRRLLAQHRRRRPARCCPAAPWVDSAAVDRIDAQFRAVRRRIAGAGLQRRRACPASWST